MQIVEIRIFHGTPEQYPKIEDSLPNPQISVAGQSLEASHDKFRFPPSVVLVYDNRKTQKCHSPHICITLFTQVREEYDIIRFIKEEKP